MVRYALILTLLLSACAQVGSITGGDTDTVAPRVLNATIQDQQVLVKSEVQTLVFDEFIKLNEPQKLITLMPNDSRLQYSLKGKTVQIEFLDGLKAETTYTLTSNGGIKDLTEGNDSLMTWTFSTGKLLDSMQINATAHYCLPGAQPQKMLLGIFETDSSKTARYVGQFAESGFLNLKGLKEGAYYFKAYVDENLDGACGALELQDEFYTSFDLQDIQYDTLAFYLSKPQSDSVAMDTISVSKDSIQAAAFGTLLINWPHFSKNAWVSLYLNEQLAKNILFTSSLTKIEQLKPGQYTIHVFEDLNGNQKWDAIRPQQKLRAETIYVYPEKVKIKGNWDIEIELNKSLKNLLNLKN